jgi:antitoxin component YwqK of YwqJK toxin-antitoxin module
MITFILIMLINQLPDSTLILTPIEPTRLSEEEVLIPSTMDCNPNSEKYMQDKLGNHTKFFVKENKHGQCLPNGYWKEWWDNRNQRTIGYFDYGKECGLWQRFHRNGHRKNIGHYCCDSTSKACKYGEEIDLWTHWFNNGKKWQEGHYCSGLQCGQWLTWWRNGNIRSRVIWQSGQPNGRYINYFQDGTIGVSGQMNMGKEVGEWTWWDRHGNVIGKKTFE